MEVSWIFIFLFACLGGGISRMAGGAPPKLPHGLDQWLYACPYILPTLPSGPWAVLAYAGAFLGKRTGHGGGIDLGYSEEEPGQGRKPEMLEYLILWLHGKINQYWYDVLLLAITGLATVLAAAIILLFISVPSSLLIIASGLMKAPSYMIGWALYPKGTGKGIPHLNEATAIGEFLTGFFAYLAIGLVL